MAASSPLDSLVAGLRDDVRSGAAGIASAAAEAMARAASEVPGRDAAELRSGLVQVGLAVLEAQPAMAPLVALVRDVLDAVDPGAEVEAARRAAREAARSFARGLEGRGSEVAARASALLPPRGDVLTLSYSSSVRDALLHGHPAHYGGAHESGSAPGRRVVVLESRPLNEGRTLAAELARAGVSVLYAVDAAAAEMARACSAVLLGADSIGDAGVVNKVGSRPVADAARRAGVPVLVVADVTKILPPGIPQHLADDRPARDVWDAPPGVEVWNRYFEAVPLDMVTTVVTASGALAPRDVEALRRGLGVPEEVRRWAARRDPGHPQSRSG